MRFYLSLLLVASVVWSAFAVIESKQERRQLYAEKEALRVQLDEMQIVWGQLQLELATFAEYGRIEKRAREKLSMRIPSVQEIRVLEP